MNNELAKTISTCAIWMSVACILTFGIFRMNVNGNGVVFLITFLLPVLIVGSAFLATATIWKSSAPRHEPWPPVIPSRPAAGATNNPPA